jgi:hypothetical protein
MSNQELMQSANEAIKAHRKRTNGDIPGNDNASTPNAEQQGTAQPVIVRATPYQWIDPQKIAKRDWLYGRIYIRKFVTATVAPGATGKTSLLTVEALSMTSAKALLGITPPKPLRVWLLNLEDPFEESQRKIQAAALHYDLKSEHFCDRLFVDSGRDQKFVIAETDRNGFRIIRPVVDAIVAEAKRLQIDAIIVDPFVSCHRVPENDNNGQDAVVKEWGRVADLANCAVHLADHTRKMGEGEITVESARGAKAKTDACREVRLVAKMTKEEAGNAGVENHFLYFKTLNGKPNLSIPTDKWDWFKLNNVALGNGDDVGVVCKWKYPDPLANVTANDFDRVAAVIKRGKYREHYSAKDWVGKAVAEVMKLNLDNKHDRNKVNAMLAMWKKAGSLIAYEEMDDNSEIRNFIKVKEGELE